MRFDPARICSILNEERVDYVVVGGLAAVILGSPLPTEDIDGPLADYRQWDERASAEEIADGLVVRVASLDDIIDSKRAANREKDLRALPYLESLRDVRDC